MDGRRRRVRPALAVPAAPAAGHDARLGARGAGASAPPCPVREESHEVRFAVAGLFLSLVHGETALERLVHDWSMAGGLTRRKRR